MPSSIVSHMALLASVIASSIPFNDFRAANASCNCLIWPRCFAGCYAILPISTALTIVGLVPFTPLYYALFRYDVHPFLRNHFCFHFPFTSAFA